MKSAEQPSPYKGRALSGGRASRRAAFARPCNGSAGASPSRSSSFISDRLRWMISTCPMKRVTSHQLVCLAIAVTVWSTASTEPLESGAAAADTTEYERGFQIISAPQLDSICSRFVLDSARGHSSPKDLGSLLTACEPILRIASSHVWLHVDSPAVAEDSVDSPADSDDHIVDIPLSEYFPSQDQFIRVEKIPRPPADTVEYSWTNKEIVFLGGESPYPPRKWGVSVFCRSECTVSVIVPQLSLGEEVRWAHVASQDSTADVWRFTVKDLFPDLVPYHRFDILVNGDYVTSCYLSD